MGAAQRQDSGRGGEGVFTGGQPVESAQSRPARPPAPLPVNRVQPGSFLTLHYRLRGPDGADVVSTFDDKPATLSIGAGQLAPAIEQQLIGLEEGAEVGFDLPAGAAFGERSADLLQRVKLALLRELGDPDATYELGDVVQFPTPDGQGAYAGVVREVGPDWLLFDFNHPLAGQPVRFEARVLGVL
jgi:FKBP-type peptidyl-prolyl cis-trans isomerase SlpA